MREYTPFIDPRVVMGWDDKTGHGVYAKDTIKDGEFVEIAPVMVIDRMPQDEILARYVVAWAGRFGIGLGWSMLYNHSDDNCCVYSSNFHENLIGIMAVRDIPPGEQLTVNYGPDWFSSRGIKKVAI